MKRTLTATALAILAFAFPAVAGTLSGDVYTDASQPISVAKGNDILVALPSNPTTGYSWTASVSNASVENEGGAYLAQPVVRGMAGSGGRQIFSFAAKAIGVATITFSYSRSFEKGKPAAKTLVFHVIVK